MSLLLNVLLVLLPSAAVLLKTAGTNARNGTDVRITLRSAAVGYLIVLPVVGLLLLVAPITMRWGGVVGSLLYSFVLAGILEESTKLLGLRIVLRGEPELTRVTDGVRYAALVGLGFAFVENLFYIAEPLTVVVLRSLTALPLHVSCAAIVGFFLAGSRLEGRSGLTGGLLAASLLHGVYDFALQQSAPYLFLALVPLGVAVTSAVAALRHAHVIDRAADR